MRNRLNPALLAGILIAPALASAAEYQIENRNPLAGEVDYGPADGGRSLLNPPSMIWLADSRAETYRVQWAPDPGFKDAVTIQDLRFNTYTHSAPLNPGTYYWRYGFRAEDDGLSDWSSTRGFIIAQDSILFPMPSRKERRNRLPAGHPRLFMRPDDISRLRAAALGSEAARFSHLRADADRMIAGGPTPEPTHRGSARDKENAEIVKYWWPNRVQTLKACEEAETIAFVYLITGDEKYAKAARRWILHLASWDPDGPTNFTLNCEAAKPLLHRLPRAYDWAYDALDESDRATVRRAMLRRATDAWESWEVKRGTGHLTRPYGSHANRTWHKLGECAIAFFGELDEAELWLDYAVNKFYACYPVWSDDDGGWHEGVSYWAGYMSKAVWWLQVAEPALGINGLTKPFFTHVGDFPLYIAPPESPNSGFGDLSYNPPRSSWGGFMEYFLRSGTANSIDSRAPYWRWWTEQWNMNAQSGVLGFLYAANLPPLPNPKLPVDVPQSKVFSGIGIASLHDTLLDSRQDVHVLFKSSPFGTQSHGHNPHNSFQLNAYGEAVLTTCVYRDLHGSKFHYQWAHSTKAHNAVLVNGKGQIKHTPAPHGRIVESRLTPKFDYVVGDATDAYGDALDRYRRHIAFLKPDIVVIYDDLAAREPGTFEFMLHGLSPFAIDEANSRLAIDQPKAGATIQYLGNTPLSFTQWDGYDPPPNRSFPNQWHVEAGTQEPKHAMGMLTVIIPFETGKRVEWTARRLESASALGVEITRGSSKALIAFRKYGTEGSAVLGDIQFTESMTIVPDY